jgi:hypothetical protein
MTDIQWRPAAMVANLGKYRLHVQKDTEAASPWYYARIDGVIVGGNIVEKEAMKLTERLARQMTGDEHG